MTIYSIMTFLLAALGLGILVFLHELGHYVVAKRQKMKIEVFSIGFGKPLLSWDRKGVRWQLGTIPFGGYVKIAGMEKKGGLEPHQIEHGFYSKKPLARIRVALAGPIVNIVLAFLLFCVIWVFGGRAQPFSQHTGLIGWVEPSSDLYTAGIRPGDQILQYDGKPLQDVTQFMVGPMLSNGDQVISGERIDYRNRQKVPFSYTLPPVEVDGQERAISFLYFLMPANYLIAQESRVSKMPEDVGILPGDRVVWVDGELVFSRTQLTSIINRQRVLLTVKRGKDTFLTQIPRLHVSDLRISVAEREELQDWAYAGKIQDDISSVYFIPYQMTSRGVVENSVAYIDEDASQVQEFQRSQSDAEVPLMAGDVIIAVDGQPVSGGKEILSALQTRRVQMVVQRGVHYPQVPVGVADQDFMQGISFEDLGALVQSIGSAKRGECLGNLCLLNPIMPKFAKNLPLTESAKEALESHVLEQRRKIEKIKNPRIREQALKALDEEQKRLLLGVVFEDRQVLYNPTPVALMTQVVHDMERTLSAVFSGVLSPKNLSGPVGIVSIMKEGWGIGVKEALFWMALISLNLGILNLLPLPILDGGHVCFALYEMITGKRIKAKAMERLIIPFAVLLIIFFIYVTYHDIARILGF